MDPVSIVGLLGTAVTIAATITGTIKTLSQLRGQYEGADLRIRLLIGELSTIKSALNQIHDWTHYLDDSQKQADVLEALQVSLDACQLAMDALAGEVNLLLASASPEKGSNIGFKFKAKYAWNESTLLEHENRLRAQIAALQLLLQAVQCTSRPEQAALMHNPRSRQIIQKVADDTSTLRASMSASGSRVSKSLSTRSYDDSIIDGRIFDWDDEIINSTSYRRASNNSRAKELPFRPISQEDRQEALSQTKTEDSVEQLSSLGDAHDMHSPCVRPQPYVMSVASEPPDAYAHRSHAPLPISNLSESGDKRRSPLLHRIKSTESGKNSFWRSLSNKHTSRNLAPAEPNTKQSSADRRTPASAARRGRRGFENSSHTSIDFSSEDGLSAPAIVRAAQAGSVVEVDMLLDQRSDINARHIKSGRNALAVASHCGNEEVVALLLQHGASVNERDASSMTPLHLASLRGHCGVANMLLQEGATIDAKGPNDQTPLGIAVENGQIEFADLLLRKKAKVNARDKKQSTPLHVAARQGDDAMTQLLVSHGAHVEAKDGDFMGATHYACEGGHEKVLHCLLVNKADIEAQGKASMTPLLCASSFGQTPVVELLLKRKASLRHKGEGDMTALHWASYNGHVEVIDLLIQKKAPLTIANKDGRTSLHLAVMSGNFAAAELLLRRGADIEAKCRDMRRPIHYACIDSHVEITRLLLGYHANVEADEGTGKNPLHVACTNGSLALVELLIQRGVSIETRDADGERPLCLASSGGHIEIVRLLLDRGAALRSKYSKGPSHEDSPICLAAQKGHLSVVQELIKRGSSVLQKDEHNWQPLRYAAFNAHPQVVELLLGHGATVSGTASGGWGFSVTAQRIGFANDLENEEYRKGAVLRLLTSAEAKEQQAQDQQTSAGPAVPPAVGNQSASVELPIDNIANPPAQAPKSAPLMPPPVAPSELAPSSPNLADTGPVKPEQILSPSNPPPKPMFPPVQFQPHQEYPPNPPSHPLMQYNPYPPRQTPPPGWNYNFTGNYPIYMPSLMPTGASPSPASVGSPYFVPTMTQPQANSQTTCYPEAYAHAPGGAGPSPAIPPLLDGGVVPNMIIGPDGSWQPKTTPAVQQITSQRAPSPFPEPPPPTRHSVGVYEMPS